MEENGGLAVGAQDLCKKSSGRGLGESVRHM